ncbi:hypothetical protein AB0N07_14855 [Streptomyces sp. NPDC051172]|uniref:hypothetical protein n=1 Tax=Streptomyces sp. NPDC051172 TaxID=3155796 RepID=UPI0034309038
MARSSSGFVFGLTVAALATVGFLGYRASVTAPAAFGKPQASASPTVAVPGAPGAQRHPDLPPAASGAGERVVYSVGSDRVWLVDAHNQVLRSFTVAPGNVDPAPGVYGVTSRSNSAIGTDGTTIEHVVRFTSVEGVPVGFSAAVRTSPAAPDPTVRTGGIRESRKDGAALWEFATIGAQIAVIP